MTDILIIFDVPPKQDAIDLLMEWIPTAQLAEANIEFYTLFKNRAQAKKAKPEAVKAEIDELVLRLRPRVISPAGAISYAHITGKKKITSGLGKEYFYSIDLPQSEGEQTQLVTPVFNIVNPSMILLGGVNSKHERGVYEALQCIRFLLYGKTQMDDCEYTYLHSNDDIRKFIGAAYKAIFVDKTADVLALDIETDRLYPFSEGAKIVCISMSYEEGTGATFLLDRHDSPCWKPPLEDREERLDLTREILTVFPLVGANFKFDLRWLCWHLGVDPFDINVVWDTFLAAWHLYNDLAEHGLEALAAIKCGFVNHKSKMDQAKAKLTKEQKASYMLWVPFDVLVEYANADADATLRLYRVQKREAIDADLLDSFQHLAMDALPYIARMELNGACLNPTVFDDVSDYYEGAVRGHYDWFYSQMIDTHFRVYTATGGVLTEEHTVSIGKLVEFVANLAPVDRDDDNGAYNQGQLHGWLSAPDVAEDRKMNLHDWRRSKILLADILQVEVNGEYRTKTGGVSYAKEQVEWITSNVESQIERLKGTINARAIDAFLTDPPAHVDKLRALTKGLQLNVGQIDPADAAFDAIQNAERNVLAYAALERKTQFGKDHKLLTSYVHNMPQFVGVDGHIHATYGIRCTETGRYNCTDPAMQTIPFKSPIKHLFQSRFENGLILNGDYSQVELRILAILANCIGLKEAFLRDDDIHRYVATQIFQLAAELISSAQRRQAKSSSFGIVYGIGAKKMAKDHQITMQAAKGILDGFLKQFPEVADFKKEMERHAKKHGEIRTLMGHRRLLPNAQLEKKSKFEENLISKDMRRAVNTPIQSVASDLTGLALRVVMDEIRSRGMQSVVWGYTHDSISLDVHPDELFEIVPIVKTAMMDVVPSRYDWIDIPLRCDFELGMSYRNTVEAFWNDDNTLGIEGDPKYWAEISNCMRHWDRKPTLVSKEVSDDEGSPVMHVALTG